MARMTTVQNGKGPPIREALADTHYLRTVAVSRPSNSWPLGAATRTLPTPPVRRAARPSELHITDAILDANLSPLAKLLPSLISHAGGSLSYADIENALPVTRPAIRPALRELEAAELVTIRTAARHSFPRYDRPNSYQLARRADSRHRGLVLFTRLPVTDDLGRSCARWILRAVFLREQFIAGAVQIPDVIAARLAGTTAGAVRETRRRWIEAGAMLPVAARAENTPPTYQLTEGPYPANLRRFAPDKRKLRTIEHDNGTLTVWGTRAEAYAISQRIAELNTAALATIRQAHGDPAIAALVLGNGKREDAGIPA